MEEEWFKVLVEAETLSGIAHYSRHGEEKIRSGLEAGVWYANIAHVEVELGGEESIFWDGLASDEGGQDKRH